MKHFKKLFFMILCAFSYSLAMQQPFLEQVKSWTNDQIARRLREITNIYENNGSLPGQLEDEQRLLYREQERRRDLEEMADLEIEHRAARKRIAAIGEPIERDLRRTREKRLMKALKNLQSSLSRLSVRIG